MADSHQRLVAVFRAARSLNEALWNSGVDSAYMSVDEFADVVRQRCKVEIEFLEVDIENKAVHGLIERYGPNGERAKIYLTQLGSPQRRVVGTKELCQIVLDLEEDFSTDAVDTLERLTSDVPDPAAPENLVVRSEWNAELLARELLYPHELRWGHFAQLEAGTITAEEIAGRFQIPVDLVTDVLTRPYLTACDGLWMLATQAQAAE